MADEETARSDEMGVEAGDAPTAGEPSDETVASTAAEAAEGLIFARYRRSAVRDVDVTVTVEDGVLDVDVYLNPPADPEEDPEDVTQEAIEAAESAVDELFEE